MKKLLTFLFVICTLQYTNAQTCADGSYSFDDDIGPILSAKCGNCHGAQGGFSVATYASTLAGGNNCGPAVTPGDATATGSSIIDKTQWVNGGAAAGCGANMPTSGTPLTAAEYMAIEAWIAAGAQESCPVPPANDLCADAIPLTVDATETCVPSPVTNVDATDSGEAAPSCASYSGGDAWYSVTVPASGNVTVETNNDGSGTVTDSGMSLYSGTCGALTEIECDDDDSVDGLFSLVELTGLTPGDVIYIRVWEFGNDVAGTFSVCAYEPIPPPPPPANDECADAISLTAETGMCTGTTPGTTTSSTESLPGCLGTANDDVWFSFVATDTNQDIDITNTGGATTDIVTEVFDACGGASLACQDTPNSPINLTGLTVGTTYYFRVYTWSAVDDTDTEFTVCVGSPPPPPVCADGTDPVAYCYDSSLVDEVIYEFCPTNPGETVTLDVLQGAFEANFDDVTYYSGAPGSGTGGTVLGGPVDGDQTGATFTSNPDECIIVVANSDGSVSCISGSQDEMLVCATINPVATVCQGIDLAAGLPVIPTTVCSGATADICLTLIDAAEGLVVTGTVDGAPVMLTGTAGANPNELCVTIDAPTNETCAPVDVVIQIDAIQCTDGTDYPGILGGATLVDDLTTAGLNPLAVPVYPTLSVTATGDGMCGDLVAELVTADGTVCATAAGSPLACANDGETLDYDFTADVAAFTDVPAGCPLPTLTGTLTCNMCTQPCTAMVALSANPTDACSTDGTVNICVDVTAGDAAEVSLDVDGTVVMGTTGDAQVCVAVTLTANQTCAATAQDYMVSATCVNGDELLPATAGSINVHPEGYTLVTAGDMMCGTLTAELQAADGSTCGTALSFACAADGETLDYDFTADADPMACTLPTLTGTLTCNMCAQPCTATVALSANPTDACSTDGTVNICVDVTAGDAAEVSLDVDGTVVMGTTGDAQVCVAVTLNTNQTCAATAQNYMVSATCVNGDELLPATAGSINVHPEGYTVVTGGDITCGTMTAELQAADGSTCGTALSFACTMDGETLDYDFTADADPMACTLPVLSGTLTCSGCICEEEITYDVIATGCDMTGAVIELLDGAGASLGTMALGMDGGFGSFGVQACGDYMFIIMGAPACYLDEGGEVGPVAFTTDGSGTTNQTFTTTIANIPTVGEWGLIILGLLMSITAVVGIRQRREEEAYH